MFCFQNTCWPSSSWSPGQRSKMWSYCQRCWKQWSRDDEFLKQCKVAANFARDKVCPQAFPTPITRTAVGGLGSSPSYIPPSGIPLNFCSLSLNPALLYSVGICTISVWFHCSIYNINICLFGLCCPFSPKLHWAVWVDSSILSDSIAVPVFAVWLNLTNIVSELIRDEALSNQDQSEEEYFGLIWFMI